MSLKQVCLNKKSLSVGMPVWHSLSGEPFCKTKLSPSFLKLTINGRWVRFIKHGESGGVNQSSALATEG